MTNPRKFTPHRLQVALLLLLLCGIAVVASLRPQAVVTVSGLTLQADRAQVLKLKGAPSFQEGSPQPTRLEYWNEPVNAGPALSLEFEDTGTMTMLRGGKPEINGENVAHWSLHQVENALGPAANVSSGQALSSGGAPADGDTFLKYPNRHLVVTSNPQTGIEFILFAGTR